MGTILAYPKFRAWDYSGNPLSGGKLYTYQAGTTTAKESYSDRACTTANANPVVLDSNGESTVYLLGNYKLILKDSSDNTMWTVDNVEGMAVPSVGKYYADEDETDQGAAGSGATIKSHVDTISSDTATIVLAHNSGSATTTYTFSTDETIPANVTLEIQPGAIISVDTGKTLTIAGGPENIIASPRQQIFSGSGSVAFTESIGKGYSSWFTTLEKAQESDIRHLVINADYSISAAVDFDQADTTIEFTNDAKVSTTDNTAHGLTISGANCKILYPYMQGPGTYVTDGTTEAALIYVTGNDCEIKGGRFVNPPSHGIYGNTAHRLHIHDCRFTTGLTSAGGDTNYMAIKAKDCDDVNIYNNDIDGNSSSPYGFIEGIKISDSTSERPNVHNNTIRNCFDHAIYGGGTYEHFHNNIVYHNQTGSGVAVVGQNDYGSYCDNVIHSTIGGGISVRNATNGCTVNDNIIHINASASGPNGIVISRTAASDGNIYRANVTGNTINFSGSASGYGVEIYAQGGTNVVSACIVANNIIRNANAGDNGDAAIYLASVGDGEDNRVIGNEIYTGDSDGIYLDYMRNCQIIGNTLTDIDRNGIRIRDVNTSIVANNIISDEGSTTSVGILEEDDGSTSRNNSVLNNELSDLGTNGINMASNTFSGHFIPNGKTWALDGTANDNLYAVHGFVHHVDPDIGGAGSREFNPTGDWPTPCVVYVTNNGGAAGENVRFNGAAANDIDNGETGIFLFDGSTWIKAYIGS